MTSTQQTTRRVAIEQAQDREFERRTLLLHIAVSRPYDAAELSQRIARPKAAIHEDLKTLMAEGAVHIHDGVLRASAAARIISEADPAALREVHDQVLAELESGSPVRPATLVALADSGCTDEALLRLLLRSVGEHPDDANALSALSTVARARGHSDHDLRLLRAAEAAIRGRVEQVLSLTDDLIIGAEADVSSRAAILAAGAHIQSNRLERSLALFRHVGGERIGHDGAWGTVAAIGIGDRQSAAEWRAAMGEEALTNQTAGLIDLADGLLQSVEGSGNGALELLARSVSTLTPTGADIVLPETPAALAALVAIGRGEPSAAEALLDRALRADLGGRAGRRRHLMFTAWTLMVQGRMEAAEQAIEQVGPPEHLSDRDLLLFWCLRGGMARRRTDLGAMREAWREFRGHTFGLDLTLFDLLPLGEMMVIAARLRDLDRVREMTQQGLDILERLDHPITWSAPLHWHGVQAAFQAEDPASLIPHANALVKAGRTSRYAATLAQAGNTWLEVLRRETDFSSVEESVRALANSGHVWDAAKLAGQAALQHPDREDALSMMQLAREITKDQAKSAPSSSLLTARELEVARLVLDGQGYRAIGEQLFISPKTVEHHVARIRSRLGATSRGELLAKLHDILSEVD